MAAPGEADPPTPTVNDPLRRRLLKGFGAQAVGQAVSLTSRLVLVPFFLRSWGVDVYGQWVVLASFVAYLQLTDLGGQFYIVNLLTQSAARKDFRRFRSILHTGLALFIVLPAAAVVLISFVVSRLQFERWIGIPAGHHAAMTATTVILALQYAIALPAGLLLGVYRSIGMLARGVIFAAATQALQAVLTVAGLLQHASMPLVAVLQLLPWLVVALVVAFDLAAILEIPVLSFDNVNRSLAISFLKPSLQFLSIQLSFATLAQGTVLLVSGSLGPFAAVVFTTLRTMTNAIRTAVAMIVNTVWPELTRLEAVGNIANATRAFQVTLRTTLVAATLLATVLHLTAAPLYRHWTGGRLPFEEKLFDLFLVYTMIGIVWQTCGNFLMSVNRHAKYSGALALSTVWGIASAFIGARFWGLEGVVIGLISSETLFLLWYLPLRLYRFHSDMNFRFFAGEFLPIGLALLLVFALSWCDPLIVIALIWWTFRTVPTAGLWRRRLTPALPPRTL